MEADLLQQDTLFAGFSVQCHACARWIPIWEASVEGAGYEALRFLCAHPGCVEQRSAPLKRNTVRGLQVDGWDV